MENIRDLRQSFGNQFKDYKERNIVILQNLHSFFMDYENSNCSFYKTAFQILYEFEKEVEFENNPDNVAISYKPDGIVMFELQYIKELEGKRRLRIKNRFNVFLYAVSSM